MQQRAYKIPESVLVVIHTPELDVLLIERTDRKEYWQSVTGSKDFPGEDLRATAAREVQEETGIQIGADGHVPSGCLVDWHMLNVYEIYPVWRKRYAPGVTRNVEHVFSLQVPRDVPVVLSPLEHTRSLWMPWREAADHCFSPSNAEAILQLPVRLQAMRNEKTQ
jgi:dATP pyrophosphohydrolase